VKGGETMKAGIFFTGSGPILILTSYDSLSEPSLVDKFRAKGIKKFIAYEVMDYDGHHVFYSFSLKELEEPIYYEE
jgi:hypothetical protein